MRKRLVIGAIATVVIGVAAYVFSQPRKGTVEYHKQKYVEAVTLGAFGVWLKEHPVPDFVRNEYAGWKYRRMQFHQQSLVDARYLTQTVFVVSNRVAVIAGARLNLSSALSEADYRFTSLWDATTNTVAVLGPTHCMQIIAQTIRDSDK